MLNADDIDVLDEDQDSLIENNLFTYCLNNPVNMADSNGDIAWWIAAAGVGALFETTFYMIGCAISGEKITLSGVGKAALKGAITGIALGGIGKVAAKVVKVASKAIKATKYTTGTAGKIGKIGEHLSGIVKNTKKVLINNRWRIPDGLTKTVLSEVKNVKKLSLTTQLKDYMQYAKSTGRVMQLYIRPDTYLSTPLKNAISQYNVVIKYLW